MDDLEIAKLEEEAALYQQVYSKLGNLIRAHERLYSGEVDQLAAEFSMTEEQINAYRAKLEGAKALIIQELLAIYQTYIESQPK